MSYRSEIIQRHLTLQSGSGRDVDLTLHFRESSGTTDGEDIDALLNLLLDNLKHRTFGAMVERLVTWRHKCGYQIPIGFKVDARAIARNRSDPSQIGLFS